MWFYISSVPYLTKPVLCMVVKMTQFTCNLKQLFQQHITPKRLPEAPPTRDLISSTLCHSFILPVPTGIFKDLMTTDLPGGVENFRLSSSSASNGSRGFRSYIFPGCGAALHAGSQLPGTAHSSRPWLMGMTLGRNRYLQGEMIGLGSGSRAGRIPPGEKGTMGVVKKFLSLSNTLTIWKVAWGQKQRINTKIKNKL